ncbi:MAG: PD40 domain-containing protein [Rhodobacteraceae bacterium]|nr:PD40 domain-containing protein [Paracoccaceae bacterium]
MKNRLIILFTLAVLSACKTEKLGEKEIESSTIENQYLGQNPPGLIPELFAPDIIQTEHREAEAAFSPDLKEFYFRRRGGNFKSHTLVVVKYQNNQWTESLIDSISGEPFISPDGQTMHLGKRYIDRTPTGWSDVKKLGAPFDEYRIMRLTSSSNGTYYFDEASESGPLRYSRLINGKHEKPQVLNIEDIGNWNAHPFIAPDESYVIWDDQRESGFGSSDLYISFRQEDHSWGPSINLGDKINTEFEDAYGSMSPDGKYFFFHRSYGGDIGDIFWVDAQFIEALKLD